MEAGKSYNSGLFIINEIITLKVVLMCENSRQSVINFCGLEESNFLVNNQVICQERKFGGIN